MASKRIYPENASEAERRSIDRLSDASAYAYGFSDEKPGWSYWLVMAAMVLGTILMLAGCPHHA